MYIPIGNRENNRGIELSSLGEWQDDAYTEYARFGFDVFIKIIHTVHLLAFAVQDNHVSLCIFNVQIVLFWKG